MQQLKIVFQRSEIIFFEANEINQKRQTGSFF